MEYATRVGGYYAAGGRFLAVLNGRSVRCAKQHDKSNSEMCVGGSTPKRDTANAFVCAHAMTTSCGIKTSSLVAFRRCRLVGSGALEVRSS